MEALQPQQQQQQQQAEPDSQQQTPPLSFQFDQDASVSSPVVSLSGTRSLTDERRVSVISASKLSESHSPATHETADGHDDDNGGDGDGDGDGHDRDGRDGDEREEEEKFEEAHETGDEEQKETASDDHGRLQPHHDQLDIPDSKSIQESITSSKDSLSVHPPPTVSPLLTTHRLSTEGMDDINLSHENENETETENENAVSSPQLTALSPRPRPSADDIEPLSPPVPAKDVSPSSTSPPTVSSVSQPQDAAGKQGQAAAQLQAPPPPLPARTPTIITPPKQTAPPPRRGGPIGWLQRVASREFITKPTPPAPSTNPDSASNDPALRPSQSRRNTDASASSNSRSTPQDVNGTEHSRRRNTLKDQFHALRMREEGIPPVPALPDSEHAVDGAAGAGPASTADSARPASAENARVRSESLASATLSVASSGSGTKSESKMRRPSSAAANKDSVLPPLSSLLNPNLPPGTVSGISRSASDASAPVNWELWQQVVNNGPSALKGENAEAFNAAIKAGIPQTIRGVIWQVLADSRNPELEEVYRELLTRGTQKEYSRTSSFSFGSGNGNGNAAATNGNSLSVDLPPSISEKPEKEGERPSADRTDSTATASSSAHSSVHSGTSTPTNGSAFSHASPTFSQEKNTSTADTVTQASNETGPKRRSKEEMASLQKLEKAIKRDLGSRTSYSKYFMSQKNQDGLFGVCKAYALYDEAIGYAQGMNFIVMPLLFNMEEGEAFTLMVKLMNKYGMREMFIQGMPGLHMRLYQFERLLEDLHPALACHLKRRGVAPILYATQWFLTLFAYRFPLQLVLRIYDLIFEEGVESTILRFSVAIMMRNANTLLGMNDMSSLTTFLKEKVFDVYIDKQPSASSILESGFFGSSNGQDKEVYRADLMVQDACDIRLTPEMIKTYTREWEEQTSAQQAAAAELEHLKRTVAAQAAKIRHLEEQSERADGEHVQLVSEIVKLKVENEELADSNEMMTVQVRELRNVVDKQQVEIEAKMREEMDRAMQRNSEVHSQNRAMEEQLAEMEKELVATKMKWAELSGEHDTLKQKWSDLRRALD